MSRTISAAKSVFLYTLLTKIITFASSIVLARILFPADYGLLVMVMIVTGFVTVVIDVGFEYYYIIKVENDNLLIEKEEVLNTIFMLRIIFNIILFIIQFFGSYFAQEYFEEDIVGEMLRILSFIYLINLFGKINETILKKEMAFKPIMQRKLISEVFSSFTKIFLAYMSFGALSFAYGFLIASFTYSVLMQINEKFRFELKKVKFYYIKKILYFAKHSFISGTGLYFTQQADKIILASSFSVTEVGLYNFANTYASTPNNYVLAPQANVMLAHIANNQKNQELPSQIHSLMVSLIYISTPIFILVFIFSEELISLIFTNKWLGSVLLFKIFMVAAYFKFFLFPSASLLTAIGELKLNSKIIIVRGIFMIVTLAGVVGYGGDLMMLVIVSVLLNIGFDSARFFISAKKIHFKMLSFLQAASILFIFYAGSLMVYLYIFDSKILFISIFLLSTYLLPYRYGSQIVKYMKKKV